MRTVVVFVEEHRGKFALLLIERQGDKERMRPDGEGRNRYRHRERQRRRGSEKLMPVTSLRPGDSATITRVVGSSRIAQRLADLGLTPRTTVYMQRCAPFNGPIELVVRGSRLAIGRDIAENIFVEAK